MRVCVALRGNFEWVLCCLDVASVVSSLSRCCVLSGTPCFMNESCDFGELTCVRAMCALGGGLCVCVCKSVRARVCVSLSGSLEKVLCCLDVASVVSSLSRCCVFCQVPCVL